jgi:hypothetical protein
MGMDKSRSRGALGHGSLGGLSFDRRRRKPIFAGALVAGALGVGACGSADELDPPGQLAEALLGAGGTNTNGIPGIAITNNSFTADAQRAVDGAFLATPQINNLANTQLDEAGVQRSGLIPLLEDTTPTAGRGSPTRGDYAVMMLRTMYECAMGPSSSMTVPINGHDTTFIGAVALAPHWGSASEACSELDCRAKVSACVLARMNAYGETVEIAMRGPYTFLRDEPSPPFTVMEGAFWGNLFGTMNSDWDPEIKMKSCYNKYTTNRFDFTRRACAVAGGGFCAIDVVGACQDPLPGQVQPVCSYAPDHSYFESCTGAGSGTGANPITVFLPTKTVVNGDGICQPGEWESSPADCPRSVIKHSPSQNAVGQVVASAADPTQSGAVVLVGVTDAASLDVGLAAPLTATSTGARDMFLVKRTSTGVTWGRRYPIVTTSGSFSGTFNFDPLSVVVASDPSTGSKIYVGGKGWVAAYDGSNGDLVWRNPAGTGTTNKHYTSLALYSFSLIAIGEQGFYASGSPSAAFTATTGYSTSFFTDFNGSQSSIENPYSLIPTYPTVYVSSDNHPLWQAMPDAGDATKIRIVRSTTSGSTLSWETNLVTITDGTTTLSDVKPTAMKLVPGSNELYIAGHGSNGATGRSGFFLRTTRGGSVSWIKLFETSSNRTFQPTRIDALGERVALGGDFSGRVDLGDRSSVYAMQGFGANTDAFIAEYSIPLGFLHSATTFGGAGNDTLDSISYDTNGNVWSLIQFRGRVLVDGVYYTASETDLTGGSDLLTVMSPLVSKNLARGKQASQSSLAWGGDPSRAVDGKRDGLWWDGSVTHTDVEVEPYWQVDLGQTHYVKQVRLWNRTDCCSDRLANPTVSFSTDGVSWASVAYSGGPSPTAEVAGNRAARYVRVSISNNNEPLSLAEVEVTGD